jgi:hypothetical protein
MSYPICPICNLELNYINTNITNRRFECRGDQLKLEQYGNHHFFCYYAPDKFSLSIDFATNMVTVGGMYNTFKFTIPDSDTIISIDKFEVCDSLSIIHKILSLKTFI